MASVVVLTGPSAAGKTTVANNLQAILPGTWLFYEVDRCQPTVSALAGMATAANDLAMTRANLRAARAYLDEGFSLIIEMDVSGERRPLVDEIFADVTIRVVVLVCTAETVVGRLHPKGPGDTDLQWALRQRQSYDWESLPADLVVHTDHRASREVAVEIAYFAAPT